MTATAAYPPARLAWSVWGLGALLYLYAFYQRVAPAVFVDRLMDEFDIGAAALGNLAAFYYYSYVAMQIPTGIIADRWGARRLLTAGAAVSAVGTALFALAPTPLVAGAGRLLVGGSVAVAFVAMLKLATHWFTPRQYTLASGLALAVGVLGGVFAGVPLRMLVEAFGWRAVMGISAVFAGVLAAAIWQRVRDDPSQLGFRSHYTGDHAAITGTSVWQGIRRVLSYRNTWLLFVVPGGMAGGVLTFAGLWGVPYLVQTYGLQAREAAAMTSAMLVAWALGSPLLGLLSERLGRRKPAYVASCVAALLGWAALIFLRPPLAGLVPLLILLGFASGNIIIGFAFAKESVPLPLAGTAAGVANMGTMLGGMLLQPGVGWLLDRHWHGALDGKSRVYDAAAYQSGFTLILVWVAASLLCVMLARETHCHQAS